MRSWIGWLVLYCMLLAALVGGLLAARRQVLETLGTPQAIAQWREWKTATEKGAETPGPIQRRPVQANEPPMLIMLRDHFLAVTISLVVVATMLYLGSVAAWRGMWRQSHHSTGG